MDMHKKWRKKLLAFCLPIICLTTIMFAGSAAYAAEQTPVEVKLAVENIFSKTGTDADIDETFDYVLVPADTGNPLPADAGNPMPAEAGAGTEGYAFSISGPDEAELAITYNRVGEYIYQIKQTITEEKTGYTYDKDVYIVKVYVKNYGESELVSEVIVQDSNNDKVEAVEFTNAYQPLETKTELMVDPPVKKIVSGNPSKDAVFTFRFAADDPEYPMPEGSADGDKIVYVTGSGETEIGIWPYDAAGTYTYTVSEDDTSESGYTYDATVYTIKDVVTDIDGQLTLERTVTNSAGENASELAFTNKYTSTSGSNSSTTSGTTSLATGDDTDNTWLTVIVVIAGVVAAGCIIYLAAAKRRKKKHEGRQ